MGAMTGRPPVDAKDLLRANCVTDHMTVVGFVVIRLYCVFAAVFRNVSYSYLT